MNRIESIARRDFLGTALSAGAFVLCARVIPAEAMNAADAAWNPSVYLGISSV